ncbi:amino acid ABC transporter ATP-binding protein [Bombilactobacillus thymidiniphilus]|uniref:ATP-binding cassette domain-containing protein n=1 Tax=Bombilactobacillus thymidiniphilus TaxID=2923363 RepID=A0ABY4PE29_9LACO|nr:ATP-binding cassette domain-containing protein [Bombilactobacillus thymidiniphilus]UQS83820.1 ATP-binding cassette domain-containing protein [Bombilactobacillus thymidiniphilus]
MNNPTALQLIDVTKSFAHKKVLDGVNLQVGVGEILSIVGPSGVGKTTLLRTILGLETVDQGQFKVNNQAFNPKDHSQNKIGIVFQDFRLFPNLTVLQNIMLAPLRVQKVPHDKVDGDVQQLLNLLQLEEQKDYYPFQLSGGQKQRVAIARALILRPQILCYDEPTSALDAQNKSQVSELLRTFKERQITQLVVTHDLEFAHEVSDRMFNLGEQTQ